MASSRRLIAEITGIGKLYHDKKNPEILTLLVGLQHKTREAHSYFHLRELALEKLQEVIVEWLTPEYQAAMEGEPSPWSYVHLDQEHVRIALDLCYKELARRSKPS